MNIDEQMLKLVSLSERQGYITYDDINSAFSGSSFTPDELDEIHVRLHNLGIEILDRSLGDNRESQS